MVNDLRQSIIVDVKELMNEDRKEFIKKTVFSIRSNIVDPMSEIILNKQTNLTPMSQPEPINQDSPHSTPQVEDLNNLIEEIDIENSPNKRKAPTPSKDIENQDEIQEFVIYTTSDSTKK